MFRKDTGWAGKLSEDYIQEKLMKVLRSDFADVCFNGQKDLDNTVHFQIIKNESEFRSFRSKDLYDYEIGVEYMDYYTDQPIYTQFKVITAVSPLSGKLIVHYVDQPQYRCSAY